jgi:hypothetical protein
VVIVPPWWIFERLNTNKREREKRESSMDDGVHRSKYIWYMVVVVTSSDCGPS